MAKNAGPAPATEPALVQQADPTVEALLWEYSEKGTHPERLKFENQVMDWTKKPSGVSTTIDVWTFIEDAIQGTGGFADGAYLIPHRREVNARTKKFTDKFLERLENADYDNFAKTIAEQPIDYVVQSQDMIARDSGGEKELEEWWKNVDGEGTSMTDFLTEFPAMQARSYGTAWIFMDRPGPVPTEADAANPENWPYVYCVPSRNVVYWKVSRRGALEGVVVLEPRDEEEQKNPGKSPVRVWTRYGWALYVPQATSADGKGAKYALSSWGKNELGVVPCVRMHDEKPKPGKGMGSSVMLGIARMARTSFNLDSEIRELERNTAFAFLALPTKNAATFDESKVTIGTNRLLPFDSDGGAPQWMEQKGDSMVRLRERKKEKKEEAFGMAHMAAVSGYVQTSSGFHAEAEFDKTNRRIGKFAKSLEQAEMELLKLWAKFRARETKANVSYPRDFGIKDLDKVYDRVQKRLGLNLGVEDAIEAIYDFYCCIYPRRSRAELRTMAEKAAIDREKGKELDRALKAQASESKPPFGKDKAPTKDEEEDEEAA